MMNTEMSGLIDHVAKLKLDGGEQGKFANRKVYEGRTAIWDLPSAETPLMLSPKKVIGFLLKYIYQLQQIPFDAKTNMNSVLDILKYPNCDPNLKFIYEKIGLDREYKSR
jgi:hypothetical protein